MTDLVGTNSSDLGMAIAILLSSDDHYLFIRIILLLVGIIQLLDYF